MPSLGDKKVILAYLANEIKDSAEDVAIKMEEVEEQSIDDIVYNAYVPNEYDRTENLKNSVDSIVYGDTKEVNIEVFHNDLVEDHESVLGEEITDSFPGIIIGGAHDLWSTGGAYTEPRDYLTHAKEKIKSKNLIVKEITKSLRSKGINAR